MKNDAVVLLWVIAIFLVGTINLIQAMDSPHESPILWAMSSRQGDRPSYEDASIVVKDFNGNPQATFLGLYDGHAGDQAAKYAAVNLHRKFAENLSQFRNINVKTALWKSFLDIDRAIQRRYLSGGTTALVAYLIENQLYIGWAGDSRALVLRNGQILFATTDHKPETDSELKRIKRSGASVERHMGIARIGNTLSVSRTLGDRNTKEIFPGAIIATPQVACLQIDPEKDIIILGCDGVWDQLNNNEVAFIIKRLLAEHDSLETVIQHFIGREQISPYYGTDEILQYLLFDDLESRGIILPDFIKEQLEELKDKYESSLEDHRSEPEALLQIVLEQSLLVPGEISDSMSNDATLKNVADRIRDFAYALSKQNFGDNVSVILAKRLTVT
jgi:protein phosphatase PTC2/3